MNSLLDKVLAWLGTQHSDECNARAAKHKADGYTSTCVCDFWQRAAADFDRRTAQHKGDERRKEIK